MITLNVSSHSDSYRIRPSCTHIVTLLDPENEPDFRKEESLGDNHFTHFFHDVTAQSRLYDAPTREHCSNILNFMRKVLKDSEFQDVYLLVHCHAGISRSTASAIAFVCLSGHSPKNAVEQVFQIQPAMLPNNLMIAFYDDLLSLNGTLIEAVKEFKERRKEECKAEENEQIAKINDKNVKELAEWARLFSNI